MNEGTEGLGSSTPSTFPMKRKRGRPRKVHGIFSGTNMPVMLDSEVQRTNMPLIPSNKNSYPNVGTADGMVGKKVNCVIEGTFNGGYLLGVQMAPDTYLRGVVFLPEQVVPVTPASDVAPQVKMIGRIEIPIPGLNQESQLRSSAPLSGQCNKQAFQAKLPVPISEDPVLPAVVQSGISVSLENQSAPVVARSVDLPKIDSPKIDSSISAGGIMPKIMSKPRPKRIETLIPVLNPESQILSSVPSSGQCNKQPFEVEMPVPMTVDPVIPTKLYFGSVSLKNRSALVVKPLSIVSSISAGGIMPTGMSKPGHRSLPASIMSEFEGAKIIKQDETLHDIDAPRQAKQSNSDGGATAESQRTSEPINLVPTVESTEKELTTGQNMPFAYNVNELIPDEPKCSISEKQVTLETDTQEDAKSKPVTETVAKVDTDTANIPDKGSKHAVEFSHPPILYDNEHVPSESKPLSGGSGLLKISDPQECSSSGAVKNVNGNKPTEVLAASSESENLIGSNAS